MHRGHDHHHEGGGHIATPGLGHNRTRQAAQWQTPHRHDEAMRQDQPEADFDLVETAFIEGFLQANDPTSFLRLAQIRFEGISADATRLALLRVEVETVADIGALSPQFNAEGFRYAPMPARMISPRKRLRFVYFDGTGVRNLNFAEALALAAT